jgi:Protein of unknown function (DUF2490)
MKTKKHNILPYFCRMYRIIRLKLLLFCFAICFDAQAQSPKQVQSIGQTWLAHFSQTRFSQRWGLWSDVHFRTKEDVFKDQTVGIARLGLMYYFQDNIRLSAGYAYIHHFPGDNHPEVARPEHRPWQQLQWFTPYGRWRTMQYLRFEQRFRRKIGGDGRLAEGYDFTPRVRYNFLLTIPLRKNAGEKGNLSLLLNEEIHVNFGKKIVYNVFDQNRFFAGFGYQFSKQTNLQFGYMNIYVQTATGNRHRNIHALRLFLMQNFDLRKQ